MSEQVVPPPAPHAGQPDPAVQAPPPAETKKSRGRKLLSILGVILVIAAVSIGKAYLNRDKTAEAKVGDCIAQLPEVADGKETKANNAKVVECTSTEAAYNVVGRVDGQTEAQAQSGEACDQYFKEGDDGYVFYSVEEGGKGYLLCLTKKA
ncbi:hypothetical protein DLE60_08945 [Micromonospora globispora]|uniref:Uncharacterized protein n=1 Tax=Micromonospora globispora TaxID=1450148 RepID=A0A317K357_9ACTN|nr:hypothetical protein [Micromonospora globispora]PWU46764.1 hypothetical protein DLJ46_16750 [Micromonospora globispora]PWU60830.1 hypothetical protein DLE60_08945 [Micromonospora globispora]RQW96021.1 hypothetical protein DKL51_13820 [Micromonospora globispora]